MSSLLEDPEDNIAFDLNGDIDIIDLYHLTVCVSPKHSDWFYSDVQTSGSLDAVKNAELNPGINLSPMMATSS